jgi:hypothetical protein
MPQPPTPKTGQGRPGQSDPENRAVTHTKPRRFSLNSRPHRPLSAQRLAMSGGAHRSRAPSAPSRVRPVCNMSRILEATSGW